MARAFQILGLNEVVASFAAEVVEAPIGARAAVQTTAARVKDTAKALVPVRTGATRASIGYETQLTDGGAEAEIGPTTVQAIFMEWGTYKDAPQAFMGPALDRHSADFEAAVSRIPGL